MIKRIWRGWTNPENADAYQELLERSIVPAIAARQIAGHYGTEILRRFDGDETEVEFVTVMTFADWEAVRAFAGGDGHSSVVPPSARRLLSHFDAHSAHFHVVEDSAGEAGPL